MEYSKIPKKQLEIVSLMNSGYILCIGISESTCRQYYLVSKGHHNVYFNGGLFGRLLENDLIYQEQSAPFYYVLTKFGEFCAEKYLSINAAKTQR